MSICGERIQMKRGSDKKMIRVGQFEPGFQVYVQECNKCGTRHESTHVLFACQNREDHCNGTMSIVQESYNLGDPGD